MQPTQNPTAPTADTTDDPTVAVTPATVLRGAAHYLKLHGWNRGVYYADNTAFPAACVTGAIGMAVYGYCALVPCDNSDDPGFADYNDTRDYLADYLERTEAILTLTASNPDDADSVEYTTDLFVWNDSDGQTANNVFATLRAAADDYDRTHTPTTTTDLDSESMEVPLLDASGYLACGCHGTQPDHTCTTSSEGEDWS